MSARTANELDQLMQRAASGDQASFRRFYELASPSILAFLLRMLGDRFQAEEVLQDAMVTAWHKAAEFDPERAAATTWITTIARRRALDILRSTKRYREVLREQAPDIRDALDTDPAPARADEESTATAKRLVDCFDQLKSGAAQCIRLAYMDGLTFAEIATRTERSLNTVKSWIRRGIIRLQGCMQR